VRPVSPYSFRRLIAVFWAMAHESAVPRAENAGAATHIVLGGGGFIGSHLAKHLHHRLGATVVVVDKHPSAYMTTSEYCSRYVALDLSDAEAVACAAQTLPRHAWVWHFAADMGGMGYLQANSAVMATNITLTLAALRIADVVKAPRFFFASSACVYPEVSPHAHERGAHPRMQPRSMGVRRRMCVTCRAGP